MRYFRLLSIIIIILIFSSLRCQDLPGSILIVGGGSEQIGGWSDLPYSWAVGEAENKRVAIIGTSAEVTEWLPNYFMNNCGAVYAKNYVIPNSTVANNQLTYDSLMTYDMIFLRGGDQYKYYQRYKNTLTEDAIQNVFQGGGVIAGTSAGLAVLSEVMFIAKYGSVYSDEALEDPYNQYMTLADDFLPLVPEVLFDSHVAERGRFGRIIGMMGRWRLDGHETVAGIGVDDKTAFCIYPDLTAVTYGTGAVSIYREGEDNEFSISGEKLLANNVLATQLIHECSINLKTFQYSGFTQEIDPGSAGEIYAGNMWLSGSDNISYNESVLEDFVMQDIGKDYDTILVVTKIDSELVEDFSEYITGLGATPFVLEASPSNGNSSVVADVIHKSNKYLFVDNDYVPLMDFLIGTPNGSDMIELMKSGTIDLLFVGSDVRFAGNTVIKNYQQEYASFDGLLEFREGIGLLNSTVIIPNTFDADYYENTATGLVYAMVLESLKYGIWLYSDNYVKYQLSDNIIRMSSHGDFPVIFIENKGTEGGLTDQSAVNSGKPRNIAGFGSFDLQLLDQTTMKEIDYIGSSPTIASPESVRIYPNPGSSYINIETSYPGLMRISIKSITGKRLIDKMVSNDAMIKISDLPKGLYLLSCQDAKGNLISTNKLIIQ